jgi:hypothetical protein
VRWILKFMVLLATGALVSTLVAWGCALWIQPPPVPLAAGPTRRFREFLPVEWSTPPVGSEYGYELRFYSAVKGEGIGSRIEAARVEGRWDFGDYSSDEIIDFGLVTVRESGWPLRCLSCARRYDPWTQVNSVLGGLDPPLWALNKVPSSSGPRWSVLCEPGLPLRPAWARFVVDSLFYAAVLATLFVGPGLVRWRWRHRIGRCTRCGYDRRGLATDGKCPECGTVSTK